MLFTARRGNPRKSRNFDKTVSWLLKSVVRCFVQGSPVQLLAELLDGGPVRLFSRYVAYAVHQLPVDEECLDDRRIIVARCRIVLGFRHQISYRVGWFEPFWR